MGHDITEHPTREGKLYRAVVLDVHSRRVVGWSIDASQTAALATNALGMAIANRSPDPAGGIVIHSDHGVQSGLNCDDRVVSYATDRAGHRAQVVGIWCSSGVRLPDLNAESRFCPEPNPPKSGCGVERRVLAFALAYETVSFTCR